MSGFAYRFFCAHQGLDPRRFRARIDELQNTQFMAADQIAALQLNALRDTLSFALQRVPYYRERYSRQLREGAEIRSAADLERLPVLTREPLFDHREALLAESRAAGGRWYSSGGSTTGRPIRVMHDDGSREAVQAARSRALGWYDARTWDPQGLIVAQSLSPLRRAVSRSLDRIARRARNGTPELSQLETADVARRFARLHPRVLIAMPSFANRLAHFAAAGGVDPAEWRVRVWLSNMEVLTPHLEQRVAQALRCSVLNEYGCTEIGSLAHRCPRGTLHLNPEHVLLELLDDEDRPVPPGRPGRVVVTALQNRAMPLIRYAVGDVAVRAEQPCACGRQPGYPGLLRVEGRQKQVWRDEHGGIVSAVEAVGSAQARLARAGFWESQFVQRGARDVEVRVHPNQPPAADVLLDVAQSLAGALRGQAAARWTGQPVERAPSGKTAAFLRDTEARPRE